MARAGFAHNGALKTLLERLAREHSRVAGWIYFCVLAWAGAYICRESFCTELSGHFASMHGEWLAMARVVRLDWLAPRWWPYWGGGAPIQFAYAPLVPLSIAALSAALHITSAMALNALTGFIYCFAPLALYVAMWQASKAPGASFWIALGYALAAPAEFVDPRSAHGLAWLITARRSYRLFEWDDLPHLTAFALFPLAVWMLARALASQKRRTYILAGGVMAVMMLASMFGLVLSALAALTVPIAMENRLRTPQLARAALVAAERIWQSARGRRRPYCAPSHPTRESTANPTGPGTAFWRWEFCSSFGSARGSRLAGGFAGGRFAGRFSMLAPPL